jgi:DeoR/GlpR family transcriptional regulator of sugar metabolism
MMSDRERLLTFRHRLEELPWVRIEEAAALAGTSVRTIRRNLHLLEYRIAGHHIWITVRSLQDWISDYRYHPTRHFDARK